MYVHMIWPDMCTAPLLVQERSWRGRGRDVGHLTEAPGAHLWRVENAAGTFLACSPEDGSPAGLPH